MTQILHKFIKKLEKIQKYKIIYKDDENVLFMIPIAIEIMVHYKNLESCTERKEAEPRLISTMMLGTTNLKGSFNNICTKANIVVRPITDKTIDREIKEMEEYIDGAAVQHYDLQTKKGNGHQ